MSHDNILKTENNINSNGIIRKLRHAIFELNNFSIILLRYLIYK